jgi:hypothetical protein
MKHIFSILLLFCFFFAKGQGIEPSSFQSSPYPNGIFKAITPIIDEFTGDTVYQYVHVPFDSITALVPNDSIFLRNDSLFLRDGSGFVHLKQVTEIEVDGGGGKTIYWNGSTYYFPPIPSIPDGVYVDNIITDTYIPSKNTKYTYGFKLTGGAYTDTLAIDTDPNNENGTLYISGDSIFYKSCLACDKEFIGNIFENLNTVGFADNTAIYTGFETFNKGLYQNIYPGYGIATSGFVDDFAGYKTVNGTIRVDTSEVTTPYDLSLVDQSATNELISKIEWRVKAGADSLQVVENGTIHRTIVPDFLTTETDPTSIKTVSGLSPLFTSSLVGTDLSFARVSQIANAFYASPNGSAGNPGFRSLVNDDLPNSAANTGSFTNANVTINSKGLVTAASNGTAVTGESTTVTDGTYIDHTLTGFAISSTIIANSVDSTRIGARSVNTSELIDNAVTMPKLADVATSTVFYRKTAGTGDPETQTLATLKTDLGLTGNNTGDQTITLTSDVTGSGTGSFATTIAANAVTSAKILNGTVDSLDIAASTIGTTRIRDGSIENVDIQDATIDSLKIKVGTIGTTRILDNSIEAADLQATGVSASTYNNVTVNTKGQVTAGSNVAYLTTETGDISGVTATSPLTGSGTTGALTIGIQNATTSQSGALTSTDWNTFNNYTLVEPSNANWNTAISANRVKGYFGNTNPPAGANFLSGLFMGHQSASNYGSQLGVSSENGLYFRYYDNGTFASWKRAVSAVSQTVNRITRFNAVGDLQNSSMTDDGSNITADLDFRIDKSNPVLLFRNSGSNRMAIGEESGIFGTNAGSSSLFVYGNNSFNIATNGTKRLNINGSGIVNIASLATGTSARMVTTSSTGDLSYTTIPTGTVGGSGTANYVPLWSSGTSLGNSVIRENTGRIGIGVDPTDVDYTFIVNSGNMKIGNTAFSTMNKVMFGDASYCFVGEAVADDRIVLSGAGVAIWTGGTVGTDGDNGQVLTSNGTTTSWATPFAPGGVIPGTGITVSGSSSTVTITNSSPNVQANLDFTGTSSPITLRSSDGTDVTFTAGNGISLTSASSPSSNMTVTGDIKYANFNRTASTGLTISSTYNTITFQTVLSTSGGFSSAGSEDLIPASTGIYEVSYQVSGYTGLNNANSQMTVRMYNNTDASEVSTSKAITHAKLNEYFNISKSFIVSLTGGKNYRLQIADTTTGTNAASSVGPCNYSIKRIY